MTFFFSTTHFCHVCPGVRAVDPWGFDHPEDHFRLWETGIRPTVNEQRLTDGVCGTLLTFLLPDDLALGDSRMHARTCQTGSSEGWHTPKQSDIRQHLRPGGASLSGVPYACMTVPLYHPC